jgi:hypothetical protein
MPLCQEVWTQFRRVLHRSDRNDGIRAHVRTDDQRLVFVVADDADALAAVKPGDVGFELGPELSIGDIVSTIMRDSRF